MSQTSYTTTQPAAFAGLLYDVGPHDIITRITEETVLEVPFGVVVAFGGADNQCELPDATTDKCLGIVVHSHDYDASALGTVGVKPKNLLQVLRKGRIWVLAENGVAPGDRGFVRAVAGAGGTQLGAIRQAAVGGETIDATTQIVFVTTALAGGLAVVEVDFTNKP